MALTKPPVLPVWADTGDKVQPTDGELSVGWPVSNIPPARQRFNWFFNFCANAVRYLTRRGLPDWAADETYLVGDRVQWTDGKAYVSLVNANTNFTPGANPAKWDVWGLTATDMTAYAPLNNPHFTGNPTAPTPDPGDADTSLATTGFVGAAISAALAVFVTVMPRPTQYLKTAATLVSGYTYGVNTAGGALGLTLPATPAEGDAITLFDVKNTWGINNVTLLRNGKNIMGFAQDLIVNVGDIEFTIWYNGTEWRLV